MHAMRWVDGNEAVRYSPLIVRAANDCLLYGRTLMMITASVDVLPSPHDYIITQTNATLPNFGIMSAEPFHISLHTAWKIDRHVDDLWLGECHRYPA